VEKSPVLGAKISQDFNIIPTSRKKFFPHLVCISSDYIQFAHFEIFLCHDFVNRSRAENSLPYTQGNHHFLIHLYSSKNFVKPIGFSV